MEKWNATLIFKVEGKEIYTNTSEWKNIDPKKVMLMEVMLGKLQEEFVKAVSKS